MSPLRPQNSEVDAYSYIKEQLEKPGWIVKNPARIAEGEVYKQNEGLYNPDIKEVLIQDMPEAIVKLNECEFWAIESKRDKNEIDKALAEAKEQYAKKINTSKKIKCILISGVAGNDTDGFTVINQYLKNGRWEKILFNGLTKDTLLSKEQADYIIKNKTIDYREFPDFREEKYLSSAEKINEILHNAGVNKNKRARFIAGLILSLSTTEEIDLRIKNTELLVKNINNLIEQKLKEVKKHNFYLFINLEVPPSEANHIKYRQAIVDTLKELQTLDIKNAMASGNDILGKFYEKFLKYGNGAREIGIVLTPRHITEFAVEVLDVKHNDLVFDPCCGTGGFLVSSFDYVKKHSNPKQIEKFKNYNLFGVEQDDEVVALALVNMIFRGDGRNNMSEGNCFQKGLVSANINGISTAKYVSRKEKEEQLIIAEEEKLDINPITKVLMNPPFALDRSDEKESQFIEYALSQIEDGGILFVIVPTSVMIGSSGKAWRRQLLEKNMLLSVLTLPEELFYPIVVHTVGVFIKKGVPHDFKNNKIYFAKANTDGFIKRKGKRIFSKYENNRIDEIRNELKAFIGNQNIHVKKVTEFKQAVKLDIEDDLLELVPEAYMETDYSNLKDEDFEAEMKKYLVYKIINGA